MNQQMQVEVPKNILENADQHYCECGCGEFVTETRIHIVSAIASPVGKRTIVQVPRLICKWCGDALVVS